MMAEEKDIPMHSISMRAIGFALALSWGLGAAQGAELPAPIFATRAEMPPDAVLAAGAVVAALRGDDLRAIENARFASGVGEALRENDFAYEGFTWGKASLFKYDPLAGNPKGRDILGKLDFDDSLGRRASVFYSAQYIAVPGGIEITAARAAPISAESPESLFYVVPAASVPQAGLPTSHADLLAFAKANGASWGSGLEIKGGKQDYVILVMVMDRLSASAKADVRLAESEIGTKGHGGASKYLLDRGWRAGIVPGTFALDETKLVVKVVFQPGKEEGFFDRTEALVGLYPLDTLAREANENGYRFATLQDAPGPYDGEWKGRGRISGGPALCPSSIRWTATVRNNEIDGKGTVQGQGFDFKGLIDEDGVMHGEASGWVGGIEVSGSLDSAKVMVSRSGYQCKWTIASKRVAG